MNFDSEYEERGFLQRYGFALGIGAVALLGVGMVILQSSHGGKAPPRRAPEVVMVRPLPPPPPPPPKPPEPPKEIVEKMIEQAPLDEPEEKPDDSPKDAAPPAVTTNLTGPGNDGFGLAAGRGGPLMSGGGANGTRSRFGWYAGQVQRAFQDALSRNRVTSRSDFELRARVWADVSGRVTRVKLESSAGDAAVDQAIVEALTGLQMQDPPPNDMPMPIVLRLTARRPS
jgi:periplasmic protein TonB